MISQIQGRLVHKSPEEIIIDIHGLGYGLKVPLSTFYQLPETGNEVILLVHTHVREDVFDLYGFMTRKEKDIFRLLIGISGVGPRLAINILSGISANDLEKALREADLMSLVRIPGVGRKTAERMLVELKDKIVTSDTDEVMTGPMFEQKAMVKDTLSALINLGYKKDTAKEAIKSVLKQNDDDLPIEDLLKKSLQHLSRY